MGSLWTCRNITLLDGSRYEAMTPNKNENDSK